MNLGNNKWQKTQGKLGSSSTGRGEAPETRGRELESLLATTEYASPTDTVVVRSVLGSPLSRTAVYGPVRTVVWQGSAGDRRPYADSKKPGTPRSSSIKPVSIGRLQLEFPGSKTVIVCLSPT